jgi:hypothetical protein
MLTNPLISRGSATGETRKVAMTNITTPRTGDADQADLPPTELEPGAPAPTTPATRPARTDSGRRPQLSPLLAIGISAGAAALAVVAIATDNASSEPAEPVTVPAVQPPVAQPVPDGVPCPDNAIRGQAMC